jgi:hypothetical protein
MVFQISTNPGTPGNLPHQIISGNRHGESLMTKTLDA